jgi:protein-S-isoprenylcysteine O-methyltransferase Ste14
VHLWQATPLWLRSVSYYTLFALVVYGALPAAGLAVGARLRLPGLLPVPWNLVGIAPVTLGVAGALWCLAIFYRRGRGTAVPYDPPHRLITSGPYAYCRNPMVASNVLALLGLALIQRSWVLLAVVLVGGRLLHVYHRTVEEPALVRRFGSQYERYRRRTPMWIPRRPSPGA